ncbi:MAG: C_GCAxxG_C_C family protein [Bacteroidales bacterium]|nr:C_GCAxxG_C_C family protein [Bacteroidales bacterium]
MKKSEYAVQEFIGGLNCAQSILSSFSDELGLDRTTAIKLTSGFGAGLNYAGKTCGAVTAAYLVLGLKYAKKEITAVSKDTLRNKIDEFNNEFKKEFGTIDCKGLLEADVSNPEELEKLRADNTFKTVCPRFVEKSALILDKLLSNR